MSFVFSALIMLTAFVAMVFLIQLIDEADRGVRSKDLMYVCIPPLSLLVGALFVFVFCGIRWFFFLR